ncbi:MAG: Uma2 family endonuclease [Oscillatoriales cyanobacterium]|nr:MAG: Uma2 family endonuclease [Oscillatoriales cyanobacterium]TAH18447.1 MAG: Uma2 family endonuclease [Oscillatoriales cyanobacterium]
MVQALQETITLDEFLQLPETKPASEYINGAIGQKPMPQGKHSTIQGRLVTVVNHLVQKPQIALALLELRCTFGGRSIVPDVAIFVWNRIPLDADGEIANTFNTHPDWTIEILSPGQSQTKVTNNILHCLNAGCQMGWSIDPDEKNILAYPAGQQPISLQEPTDILPVPEFMGEMQLTLGEVFGWLKPGNI